jgi:hypothetical protein
MKEIIALMCFIVTSYKEITMSVDFDYKKAATFFKTAENQGSKEARNFFCEVSNFLKNNIPEDRWRSHSLHQKQPGARISINDWLDNELEVLFYNEAEELIASYTMPSPRHCKIMEDGRSLFRFKFYAKNCDNRWLWEDRSYNNALYIDRLNYYKPTEWDRNNNYFISLSKANEDPSEDKAQPRREFGVDIESYPNNLPYVAGNFYLNFDEFKQMVKDICDGIVKRPSNFLIDIWPSSVIQKLASKLESVSQCHLLDEQNYHLIAKYLFYSAIIQNEGYCDDVIDKIWPSEKCFDSLFKTNFKDPFPNLYKEEGYEVSRFWSLQTLIMRKDALKKIIFKDMKEYLKFKSDLYTQDENELRMLFNKQFLGSFIDLNFKGINTIG